jgi:hypothetical protein
MQGLIVAGDKCGDGGVENGVCSSIQGRKLGCCILETAAGAQERMARCNKREEEVAAEHKVEQGTGYSDKNFAAVVPFLENSLFNAI